MPLEPDIAAQFWIKYWDKSTTAHEKELISWVADLFYSALQHDAEYSFQLIEAIHKSDPEQIHVEVFAAGPVEDLLSNHGPAIIEKIEDKARNDATFAHVLGGVWKSSMSDEIWERVKSVRKIDDWADPAEP